MMNLTSIVLLVAGLALILVSLFLSGSLLGPADSVESDVYTPYAVSSAPADCDKYMKAAGCGWTSDFSCPGQPIGAKGEARQDGSIGYNCCCQQDLWMTVNATDSLFDPASIDGLNETEYVVRGVSAAPEFSTMPFAGPASVYGTNGWYKWGGKSTCGISRASNANACNFTLRPQGPALDPTSPTGLAGGVELPTGKCTFATSAMTTVTFAASPEQYGTNGYWRVNLKKSTKEDGTAGPMIPDCDRHGNCKFTMHPQGPAYDSSTSTGTAEDQPLPNYEEPCANEDDPAVEGPSLIQVTKP